MRLRIDTSEVKFRVAGTARPKKDHRDKTGNTQARTLDGAPVWVVRLTAIEADRGTAETIWVEVAGDEPKLTLDDLAQVHGLTFAPWVNRQNKIVRSFRADAITADGQSARRAA
jgi:phenolic acid decarboxylase